LESGIVGLVAMFYLQFALIALALVVPVAGWAAVSLDRARTAANWRDKPT
jgi:hypothetical protein